MSESITSGSGRVAVSVVVLTYNRRDMLCQVLSNVGSQTIRDKEIVVVDNNSTDGTYVTVRNRFPDVTVIRTEQNLAAAGRNVGIRKTRGDIVVTIDDDIFFRDKDALGTICARFRKGNVDALCFKIVDPIEGKVLPNNWYHPRVIRQQADVEFETDYISEGAVAFRRDVFERAGYYPEDFFLGHEGYDLALRMIDCGCVIRYCPQVTVIHKHSFKSRERWRNPYYDTRNMIWLLVRNYPLLQILRLLPYKLLTSFIFCLSRSQGIWFFRGVYAAVRGLRKQWRERKPVSRTTVSRLKQIRENRPNVFTKIREFSDKHRSRKALASRGDEPGRER